MGEHIQFLESIKKLVEDYMLSQMSIIENQMRKASSSTEVLQGCVSQSRELYEEPSEKFKHQLRELKEKMDRALVDVSNKTPIPVDQVIDFQRLGKNIQSLVGKFDTFNSDLKKTLEEQKREARKSRSNPHQRRRFTDFNSDTECTVALKSLLDLKWDKMLRKLKNPKGIVAKKPTSKSRNVNGDDEDKKSDTEDNDDDDDDDIYVRYHDPGSEPESVGRNHQSRMFAVTATAAEPFLKTIIRSPSSQPSEYLYETANDESTNSSSRSSLDSSILIEDDEPIITNNQSLMDKQAKKPDLNDSIELTSDDDIFIVRNGDQSQKKRLRKMRRMNPIMSKIQEGIKMNESKSTRSSIYIGMKVLGLKDRRTHQWALGTLMRISDNQDLLNVNLDEENGIEKCVHTQSLMASKFFVQFDDEENGVRSSESSNDLLNHDLERDILSQEASQDSQVENDSDQDILINNDNGASSKRPLNSKNSKRKRNRQNRIKINSNLPNAPSTTGSTGAMLSDSTRALTASSSRSTFTVETELDWSSIAFINKFTGFTRLMARQRNARTNNLSDIGIQWRVVSLCEMRVCDHACADRVVYENDYLCSGTIVEMPLNSNYNRCLIFFDNGIARYVQTSNVFPIFDLFTLPHERLNLDHSKFLNHYFEEYPNRNMVQLKPGHQITVFFNGSWRKHVTVKDTDCSLMQVTITSELNLENEPSKSLSKSQQSLLPVPQQVGVASASESGTSARYTFSYWIFRGSYSLQPMYENAVSKASTSLNPESCKSFYKYVSDKLNSRLERNDKKRLVNNISVFASSLFPDFSRSTINKNLKNRNGAACWYPGEKSKSSHEKVTQGQIRLLDMDSHVRREQAQFVSHACSKSCVEKWECTVNHIKHVNPLLMPQFHGWQRLVKCQSKTINSGSKKTISYMAPCGRTLRSIAEVDRYLVLTNSKLTIDFFSFDATVLSNREFEGNARFLKIDDLSIGREKMPISCVNCVDETRPDDFEYLAKRTPLKGVPLRVDHSQLDGCNCTDNCRDRMKCSCWRKTFEATKLFGDEDADTDVGYRNRRLNSIVSTGIFECNPKCKCDCRCANRVVQNGMSIRLQLFKTAKKGWGLRCLDDLPKGAFVCTYEGEILTENQADERGKEIGDEYFAEIDFIECLRKKLTDHANNDGSTNHLTRLELSQESRLSERDAARRRTMTTTIDSNRFFTDPRNPFYVNNFLEDQNVYVIDAKLRGNIGRYFNHSCGPNVFVQNVFVDSYDLKFPWVAFFTTQAVKAGTELCWDYNYTIDSVQGKRLDCHCGAMNCRGRLL